MKFFSSVEAHIFIVVNKVKGVCMREWPGKKREKAEALLFSFLFPFFIVICTLSVTFSYPSF